MESFHLALDLVGAGRLEESMASFELAIQQNPLDTDARVHYARALAQLEQWPALKACLEQGIALHAHEPEQLCPLAWALFTHGYVRRARLHLESAWRDNPENPLLNRELGRLACAQDRWETALTYLQRSGHHGLLALVFKRLGRYHESYRSWTLYLREHQEEMPELQAFSPVGTGLYQYGLRYGSLLFQVCLSELVLDESGWHYRATPQELAEALLRFVTMQRVFGWPITAVSASTPDAEPVAVILSNQLGVKCCALDELWPEDFVLLVGLTQATLGVCRIPNGLTFALSGRSEGPNMDDAPDLTAVVHQRPVCWRMAMQCHELEKRMAESGCLVPDLCERKLRPALQPRPGWQERQATVPKVSEAQLCELLRRGNPTAFCWIQDGEASSQAIRSAAEEALSLIEPDCAERWLELFCTDQDEVVRVWQAYPSLRKCLFDCWEVWMVADQRQLCEWALMGDDPDLRARAVSSANEARLPLSDEVVASLNLGDLDECELWLRHQTSDTVHQLLNCAPEPPLLEALLTHLDNLENTWASDVRRLLDHPCSDVRTRAAVRLAEWDNLTVNELLKMVPNCPRGAVLRALARADPNLAETTAVHLLSERPEQALRCLQGLGSALGLERCRQLIQRGFARDVMPRVYVGYLDEFGEDDEEMLETALLYQSLQAARALICRGFPQYWEVFRLNLESRAYDLCAEELLDWGSEEALETLLQARNADDLLQEISSHLRISDRVRHSIEVCRARRRSHDEVNS